MTTERNFIDNGLFGIDREFTRYGSRFSSRP